MAGDNETDDKSEKKAHVDVELPHLRRMMQSIRAPGTQYVASGSTASAPTVDTEQLPGGVGMPRLPGTMFGPLVRLPESVVMDALSIFSANIGDTASSMVGGQQTAAQQRMGSLSNVAALFSKARSVLNADQLSAEIEAMVADLAKKGGLSKHHEAFSMKRHDASGARVSHEEQTMDALSRPLSEEMGGIFRQIVGYDAEHSDVEVVSHLRAATDEAPVAVRGGYDSDDERSFIQSIHEDSDQDTSEDSSESPERRHSRARAIRAPRAHAHGGGGLSSSMTFSGLAAILRSRSKPNGIGKPAGGAPAVANGRRGQGKVASAAPLLSGVQWDLVIRTRLVQVMMCIELYVGSLTCILTSMLEKAFSVGCSRWESKKNKGPTSWKAASAPLACQQSPTASAANLLAIEACAADAREDVRLLCDVLVGAQRVLCRMRAIASGCGTREVSDEMAAVGAEMQHPAAFLMTVPGLRDSVTVADESISGSLRILDAMVVRKALSDGMAVLGERVESA